MYYLTVNFAICSVTLALVIKCENKSIMADVRSGSVEFAVKAVFPLANLLVQIDIFFLSEQ